MPSGLMLLGEDAHELVVWKPAGLASELRDLDAVDSVRAVIAAGAPGRVPKLPHRLDRVTRGILVVCLSQEAVAFQGAQIKARRWEKYYLARVVAPTGRSAASFLGTHKAFLSESNGRAELVRSGGKPAWLEILAAAAVPGRPDRWHLIIRLLSGRFHQIRVMCESFGLPLAGDSLYDPQRRDPAEFYLEHVLLRYRAYTDRQRRTIFVRELAERGPLSEEIAALLAELAAQPPSADAPEEGEHD